MSSFAKVSEVTITLGLLTLLCIHFVKKTNANVMFTVCGKLKVSMSIFFLWKFSVCFPTWKGARVQRGGEGGLIRE